MRGLIFIAVLAATVGDAAPSAAAREPERDILRDVRAKSDSAGFE